VALEAVVAPNTSMQKAAGLLHCLVPHQWLHASAKGNEIATHRQTNKVAASRCTAVGEKANHAQARPELQKHLRGRKRAPNTCAGGGLDGLPSCSIAADFEGSAYGREQGKGPFCNLRSLVLPVAVNLG
jgi:hypothetical protein